MARNPASTSTLHFVDGQWHEPPIRQQVNYPQCLGLDGKIVPGSRTELTSWSVEPQPDGTLRGIFTETVLTGECGGQGDVYQIPLMVTRTGDVPGDVRVPDAEGVPVAPPTSTPKPPAPGPVLSGTYRLEIDSGAAAQHNINTGATVNGNSHDTTTVWWAFRSLCTTARCVATGARLSDNNEQVPVGGGMVLEFSDGRWQNTQHWRLSPAPATKTKKNRPRALGR